VVFGATVIGTGLLGTLAGMYVVPLLSKAVGIRQLRRRCCATLSLVLTYDDGPGDELTPALLELLAAADARATFFPTGRSATRNPELLTRVAAAGHEIGCHSQEHLHAWRIAPWRNVRDIDAGYQTLARWVPPSGLYRPPYGKASLATWWVVRRRRAAFAWWTVNSGDTHAVLPAPESVVEQVRRDGGGVVLMHDFDRSPATRAVRHAHVLRTTELLLDHTRHAGL
jgi:peptidoglycan/xylan/chitin deacetylase (PgdA/CDA1 family)